MFRASLAASLGLLAVATLGVVGLAQPAARSSPATIAAPASQLSQLLGFSDARLVRVDPETLRPRPGKGMAVGSGGCAPRQGGSACWSNPPWTASPDGARVALARNDLSSLQVVDASRLRVTASVQLRGGPIGALAWLPRGRLLALEEVAGEQQRLVVIDLATKRVLARRPLGGSVVLLGRTPQELVMLLAPAQAIGPARIAIADSSGTVRFVGLPRILAGSKLLGTGSNHRVDSRLPGLAVDSQGRRAFVVAQGLAAEVDLRTLAVSYHSLDRPASFLSRLWNWLEPAAAAKQVSGYYRSAQWLGDGLLAASGTDSEQARSAPAGLLTLDTQVWNPRTVDRGATSFWVAGELLLATGWETGIGLTAYGFDGVRRLQLFDGKDAWLGQVYGGRAYVGISGEPEPLRIVELATGRVVGTRQQPLPELLLGAGSGWWGDG